MLQLLTLLSFDPGNAVIRYDWLRKKHALSQRQEPAHSSSSLFSLGRSHSENCDTAALWNHSACTLTQLCVFLPTVLVIFIFCLF